MNTIKVSELSAFTPVISRRIKPVSLPVPDNNNQHIIKNSPEYNNKKNAYAYIKQLFGTSSDTKLK